MGSEAAGPSAERALAAAAGGVLEIARDGTVTADATARALLGLDGGASLAGLLAQVEEADRPRLAQAIADSLATPGLPLLAEVRLRGEGPAWVLASGSVPPPHDASGLVLLLVEVTALRSATERRELLLREADHRARNALSAVQAVLRFSRADDPERFTESVQGRVGAMVRAHALLSQGSFPLGGPLDGFHGSPHGRLPGSQAAPRAELSTLLQAELAAYLGEDAGADRALLRGPSLALAPSAVQPMSLVLHELATNAAKHGALALDGGRLEVAWDRLPPPGEGLRLRWSETGGPPVIAPPGRRGFGSTLIDSLVRGQLGGQLSTRWEPTGLRCLLTLPAAVLA